MNADNASSNDTQTEELAMMGNSFEEEYRVRCFNHTLQLSAKTLLRPFNAALGKVVEDDDANALDDLLDLEDDDDDDDGADNEALPSVPDVDDVDDGIDELDELDEDAQAKLIEDTAAVRQAVSKVC
jgi:hypothetical protein